MAESLRMYAVCKMMKWSHLPVGGGIYAQSPKLMDDFLIIAGIEGQLEDRRQKKQQRDLERQRKQASSGRKPRRR